MIAKLPLIRRITVAFVMLTVLVSGVFSLGIVKIVHYIEEQLISEELAHEIEAIIDLTQRSQPPPPVDPNTHFYASGIAGYETPAKFAGLADGFMEWVEGDEALYVYKRTQGQQSYLLVQDQREFEAREDMLFLGVMAGFIISLLLAWVFGRLVARHAVAPVIRLAQQVRNRDQMVAIAPPLATEYSRDEVGDLAAAFDNAIAQLQQALEREHLFTSDVSHELRTPLMIMASSCELLLESPAIADNERRQLQRIDKACREMRELIDTFLLLARKRGENSISAKQITLAAAAREQFSNWQDKFAAKGLEFVLVQQGADESLYPAIFLNTVISNLLRNALHYTEQGGVRLILDENGFSVQDTGSGIPANQRERVFQPFIRGDQSRGEGLGLGLSLVRRICHHQGWAVDVHTAIPHGSIFHVRLKKTGILTIF